MMFLVNLIGFIFVLGLVILIHELGHFLLAKRAGILCHEFALGMGPIIYSKKIGETRYSVRAFPIGGYVSMAGEEVQSSLVKQGDFVLLTSENDLITTIQVVSEETEGALLVEQVNLVGEDEALSINERPVDPQAMVNIKGKEIQIAPLNRSFGSKSLLDRFLTIFAGPFMNFVLAYVIFVVIAFIVGFSVLDQAEIGALNPGLPAASVLEVGDIVTDVNGQPTQTWDDFTQFIRQDKSVRELELQIIRNQEVLTATLTPRLFFYSVGFNSHPDAVEDVVIGPVVSNTLAFQAGFQENDEIIRINQHPITSWGDLIDRLEANQSGQLMTFTVLRGGEEKNLELRPFEVAILNTQSVPIVDVFIGVSPPTEFRFFPSFAQGASGVLGASRLIFDTIRLLFNSSQVGVGDLAGPIGIFSLTSDALAQGLVVFLNWIGLLSVNLGILNLLPIPALDGGRLVFLGYEGVTRKKVNPQVENYLHFIMFFLLIGFFIFIAFNDILRLFN
jgi:regulator of sigma E protease